MPELILTVGNQLHQGWKKVSLFRSIEHAAHAFDISLTDRWGEGEARAIKAGESCTLKYGNELLITGYIDAVEPSHDANSHSVRVRGRSKPGDLVDCSISQHEYKSQDLLQIAKALASGFGINVSSETDIGDKFTSVRLASGQPIWEFLEQLARIRAVRFVSDINGDLVITTAGANRADTSLELGVNIKSAQAEIDHSQLYSAYLVKAQQGGGSLFLNAETAAFPEGEAKDKRVTRYRPLTIESETTTDKAGCQTRAEWARNTHFGRARSTIITVTGWQQKDGGRTWMPNELVPIDDDLLGIKGDRLIRSVTLLLDKNGTRTELAVVPKEAFELTPLPEPEETDVWG